MGWACLRMRKVLQTAGLVFECVTCFFRACANACGTNRGWRPFCFSVAQNLRQALASISQTALGHLLKITRSEA